MGFLGPLSPGQPVRAIPGTGTEVPVWILGSSLYGAQLAAALGLPYAFASHFAPEQLESAIAVYREHFRPSPHLAKPYVMLGISVFAAETDAEAKRLFTSHQQAVINLRSGRPGPLPPPIDDIETILDDRSRAILAHVLTCAFVGSPVTVEQGLNNFIARHRPDELIVTGQIYDHTARVKSFEILSKISGLRPYRARKILRNPEQDFGLSGAVVNFMVGDAKACEAGSLHIEDAIKSERKAWKRRALRETPHHAGTKTAILLWGKLQ
jgi:hypothetical protein